MTNNHTQTSHPPLELPMMNMEHNFDIHSSLPINITAASQPLFLFFNQNDMNPSDTVTDGTVRSNTEHITESTIEPQPLPVQDTAAFLRRHREQRQRLHEAHQHLQQERQRINQEQRRIDQERARLNGERNRERRRRQQLRYIQCEQRRQQRNEQQQIYSVRQRSPSRYDDRHFREMIDRDPLAEPMDDMYNERLIEIYNYEMMNSQERQEAWDQEHLREMQGLSEPQYSAAPPNSLENYASTLELQLERDRHEQYMSIYEMHHEDYLQQWQRNEEQLMDKEEWEDIAFRLQQQR